MSIAAEDDEDRLSVGDVEEKQDNIIVPDDVMDLSDQDVEVCAMM